MRRPHRTSDKMEVLFELTFLVMGKCVGYEKTYQGLAKGVTSVKLKFVIYRSVFKR